MLNLYSHSMIVSKSMHFLYKLLRTVQYFHRWLNGLLLIPFSQPYHVAHKLLQKLSLHISCYAQQARTVYHRISELSPFRQAITAHLILLHFNCRSHSSFAVRSSNPCLQFFTITHALINQPCHHGINCPPYAVWLTMHHTDRRLQTGASLLRSSFNASWTP